MPLPDEFVRAYFPGPGVYKTGIGPAITREFVQFNHLHII